MGRFFVCGLWSGVGGMRRGREGEGGHYTIWNVPFETYVHKDRPPKKIMFFVFCCCFFVDMMIFFGIFVTVSRADLAWSHISSSLSNACL